MSCYSRLSFRLFLSAAVALLLIGGGALRAQVPEQDPGPPQGPPPDQVQNAPQPQQTWTPDQLDDLVAPIALYPDQLLSQVLVASTYPLEVVEAQQWTQRNSGLRGQQLMDAARQQNWDASVQALVAFPDVLARLNQDVRWTTELGNAFLAQQADVMAAVQRMRQRAQANGKLQSSPQQSVTTETQDGQSAIQIQPTDPNTVYVPYYDPNYVWGPPAYGYYPPLYYPAYGFGYWPGIDIGLCFGGWGGWGWGGWGWGWGPNWFGHSVFVNTAFFNRYGYRGFYGRGGFYGGRTGFVGGRTSWAHDPGHRLGVSYPTRSLNGRFGAASMASRANFQGGRTFGSVNRGVNSGRSFEGSRAGGGGFAGSRYQSGRSMAPQGGGRSYGGNQSFRSSPNVSRGSGNWQSFGSAQSRSFAGSAPRSNFNGGASRSFNGGASGSFNGGASRSFNGGASRSFAAPRSYSAPSAPRSFSAPRSNFGGGSAPRSFSAPRSSGGGSFGGGSRSFGGGGGGHSFGGGGGHSFGGGGSHGGGGGGGHHR